MTELNFYIKKLHNLQFRGDWKDTYTHIHKEIHGIIYNSYSIRKNYYLEELDKLNTQMFKLPYIQNDEDKLNFRKIQKHLIDLLHQIKEENKKIFIVFGKDTAMKDKVSSYLGRLKLDYTVIEYEDEKSRHYIDFHKTAKECDYAIVLLSADNHVRTHTEQETDIFRASQKVLFQLGYFLAMAGKKNVMIFHTADKTIETPFSFDDLPYKPFDNAGHWKKELVDHLRSTGVYVDEELMIKI